MLSDRVSYKTIEIFLWIAIFLVIAIMAISQTLGENRVLTGEREEIYLECLSKNLELCVIENGKRFEPEESRECLRKLLTRRKWFGLEGICRNNAGL